MLDALSEMFERGGSLRGVSYATWEGDGPTFIGAVGLRFETLSATLRADPAYDALTVTLGELTAEPDERLIDASALDPWSAAIGHEVRWAWRLTNQQGYDDGVRMEFGDPPRENHQRLQHVVELIVAASSIWVSTVRQLRDHFSTGKPPNRI